jgi:hypothetical protein
MSLVGALQQALATEHEAVYGYGVVGAHSPVIAPLTRSATQHKQVGDRLIEHKVLRDALEELIRRLGATPVAAQFAYQLPFRVHARRAAARLARQLEEACEQAAWAVISASRAESPARRLMVRALAAAATWDTLWAIDGLALASDPAVPSLPGQPGASQPSTTPTSSSS